jgi:RIO kinase 1
MEMVADANGHPAPRLAEVTVERAQAIRVFERLLGEVVRMLCAGVVHGDLSDFNVLMSAEGPVIIDFPQSVDAASNQNARKLLLRDVENLKRFLSRFAPEQRPGAYAEEMWDLYARSLLTPETRLTGRHRSSERRVNTTAVLDLIGDANYDERKRRERQGLGMRGVPAAPAGANVAGARPQRPHPRGAPPPAEGHRPRNHPPRQQVDARPPPDARHRPDPRPPQPSEEPQAAAPRRRVVITVEKTHRPFGSRRNP